jgi:membrane-bound lytic murein transglycosylase D
MVVACAPLVMLAGCPQNQGAAKAKVPAQATAPVIANGPAANARQTAKAATAKAEPVNPAKAYKDQQLINHAEQLYRSGVDNYSAGHLDA